MYLRNTLGYPIILNVEEDKYESYDSASTSLGLYIYSRWHKWSNPLL
jgi:hypothetical protein